MELGFIILYSILAVELISTLSENNWPCYMILKEQKFMQDEENIVDVQNYD
jgi:hypothetical protein